MKKNKKLKFPILRSNQAKLLADDLLSVTPIEQKIKSETTNHWGDKVVEYEDGNIMTFTTESHLQPGDSGHAFGFGFFIVNEKSEMVFMSDEEEYVRLAKKYQPLDQISSALNKAFPGYRIERSRGDRIAVNDKIIDGVLFTPLMDGGSVEKHIEFIKKQIQKDIDGGRIKK